jgi:alanine racemase
MEVDLGVYASNLKLIRRQSGSEVMPVLKADAYGHGAVALSRVCEESDVSTVVVASVDEGVELRRQGFRADILLLGNLPISCIAELLNYRLTPTLCDPYFVLELDRLSRSRGVVTDGHLYIDTGMGRMGLGLGDSLDWWRDLRGLTHVRVRWVYSHFAVADELDDVSDRFSAEQWSVLEAFLARSGCGLSSHMANSAALLRCNNSDEVPWAFGGAAVRPGLLTYGVSPLGGKVEMQGLSPLMRLCCRPVMVKRMKKGDSVGYGRSYVLGEDANIMTLPVGYGDGVPRSLGRGFVVALDGVRYPVVGRVCMDMLMVDMGDQDCSFDAEVDVLGGAALDLLQWSDMSGRLPYEILTGLGPRWTKAYIRNGLLVDVVKRT